jgi:hypothetical protein
MNIADMVTRRDAAIALHLDAHAAANDEDLEFLRAQFEALIAGEKTDCEAEVGAIRAAAEVQVAARVAAARARATQFESTYMAIEANFAARNARGAALSAPVRTGAPIMPPASVSGQPAPLLGGRRPPDRPDKPAPTQPEEPAEPSAAPDSAMAAIEQALGLDAEREGAAS